MTDLAARRVAEHLSTAWGQPVIIENKPGADGILGSATVAKARPDGYTLLITNDAVVTSNLYLHKDIPYSIEDFTPISVLCQITPVLAVNPALGANSFAELVSLAKAKPGKIAYASFGSGSYAHLSTEDLKQRTGIDLNHVPYKGSAPAVAATVSGETGVLIINYGNIAEHVKNGRLKILGAATSARSPFLPEIPTIDELGVKGFSTNSWFGFLGPRGLPSALVDRLNREIAVILQKPNIVELFKTNTLDAVSNTPDQFEQLIADDSRKWEALIKMTGAKLD